MKNKKIILSICLGILFSLQSVFSQQQILLDKQVGAGELVLYPSVQNESHYYYLPNKPRLAMHKDGKPQLSFTRYVKNEKTDASSNSAISESATGGGIVHALVELKVTKKQIRDAENALRRIDGDGKIIGPVVFSAGTVALISSVAQPNGENTQKVIGLGNAPVLENQSSAVSVQLNKLGSKILWETFNTSTPDFTFNFEMEVEGYLSPKRVLIEANFDRMYSHQTFSAAATTPVLAAEIKAAMDDLYDSGAIKLTQIGEDEQLEKLKETAYQQLTNLMFDKVGGSGIPQLNQLLPNNKTSMLDRASNMLKSARAEVRKHNDKVDKMRYKQAMQEAKIRTNAQERAKKKLASNGKTLVLPEGSQKKATIEQPNQPNVNIPIPKKESMPSLAVAVSYQLKKVKRSGSYKIDLNKYTQTKRSIPFAYNPGNVKRSCPTCFLEVNLEDPLMKQREINASLGGVNAQDFAYINFVNIIMRKKHQNGHNYVDEIKIDKSQFNQQGNFFKMIYGWHGDSDRDKWLEYEYKTLWSFKGGHKVETAWKRTKFGSIALNPPIIKKPIYIEVDEDFVVDENVRGIEVKLFSNPGEKPETQSINMKTLKDELSKTVEVLLPKDAEDYQYEVTYFVKGKNPKKTNLKKSNYGRIDIDRFMD